MPTTERSVCSESFIQMLLKMAHIFLHNQ